MSNSLKWEDTCAVMLEKKKQLENNRDQDYFKEPSLPNMNLNCD